MVMCGKVSGCMVKLTLHGSGDCESTGHAEMHHQYLPRGEVSRQKLRLAGEPVYPRVCHALGKPLGQWKAQVRTPLIQP